MLVKAIKPKLSSSLVVPPRTALTPKPNDSIKGTEIGPVVTAPASMLIGKKEFGTKNISTIIIE